MRSGFRPTLTRTADCIARDMISSSSLSIADLLASSCSTRRPSWTSSVNRALSTTVMRTPPRSFGRQSRRLLGEPVRSDVVVGTDRHLEGHQAGVAEPEGDRQAETAAQGLPQAGQLQVLCGHLAE